MRPSDMLSRLMGRAEQYTLRFEAGVRAGEILFLLPDHELVLGRASGLDVTLDDSRVSRHHAAVGIAGHHVVVRDLGSRNGTFVNGARVEKARVKPGDRIRIGSSVIVVELGTPAAVAAEWTGPRVGAGRGEQTAVVEVLARLAAEGRTGRLAIQSEKECGGIYLRDGHLSFASLETQPHCSPRKAFFRLVASRGGAYEFSCTDPGPVDLPLGDSTRGLLNEVPEYLAALGEMQDQLPLPDASLLVPSPPPDDVKKLSAEEFEVYQLVRRYGTLHGVLDHFAGTDLEAAWHFTSLLQRGFIEVL